MRVLSTASEITSPPSRVPIARHVAIGIELLTNRTLPSQRDDVHAVGVVAAGRRPDPAAGVHARPRVRRTDVEVDRGRVVALNPRRAGVVHARCRAGSASRPTRTSGTPRPASAGRGRPTARAAACCAARTQAALKLPVGCSLTIAVLLVPSVISTSLYLLFWWNGPFGARDGPVKFGLLPHVMLLPWLTR